MSWQDYVDNFLVNHTNPNTGKSAYNICQHGAIVGNQDGTVWAATAGFTFDKYSIDLEDDQGNLAKVEIDEFASLKQAFDNNGVSSMRGGIRINKEKYFIVSYDSERQVLYLKKNGGGAAIAKSNLGFVTGTFAAYLKSKNYDGVDQPQNPGLVNFAVEELQKFLTENSL